MTHADAFPRPHRRRRDPVDAQSGHLVAGALACNMPEPLVHDTGVFVFVQVQTIETRVGKALCPMRLFRQLRSLVPLNHPPPPQPKENCHDPTIQFLRRALLADAIFSGVSAVGLTLRRRRARRAAQSAGSAAARDRAVPDRLYRAGRLARLAVIRAEGAGLLVVVGNAAWTLASIALLFSGAVSPNLLGEFVMVAQAIATGVFAELQFIGLRKSGGAVAA